MAVAGQIFTHCRADLEATRGAGGTPDTKVIFETGEHLQSVNTIYPTRLSGEYEDHYDASAGTETNEFNFGGLVDFNQMAFWGNLFFKTVASGTGAGADKTWAFLPTQTSDDLKSAMLQFGVTDSLSATQPGWQVPYVVGQELTLTFSKAPDSPGIGYSARLISPRAATQITAYTGAAAEPTLQLASHIGTQVTIDASTLGSTADNYVTNVEFRLNNGFVNLYSLNNSANAQDTFRPAARDWSATITRYWVNDTELDAYIAKTLRKIRIRTTGAVLGGSNYRMDLELYGVYTNRTWTEVDGLKMEVLTLSRRKDSTAGTSVNLNLVNSLASV
jgi:hypothetical protein